MNLDTEVPRSFETHASLCNNLSSIKLCPKTVKILALKGLKGLCKESQITWETKVTKESNTFLPRFLLEKYKSKR